ncbi:response regulator [Flavobacterium terrigena]|uniref:cAMP-binding domain of CRP or a regulatory subunit of cAMP-dependent protein kinases n=1 Tax=Flavobacterium terrigena TaxID=402734 RepID=A0A1H6QH52_9FLAO|nr:response regulator [Flavobacterium terrigena]SEI40314.1 cAMP-binding domain of CRP or a regulatory subunit of cAMP-dependent protein kinases [Flavobacterium terrigena]
MDKILVIEDNFEMRDNISEILELAGYKVYSALNGKIGVEMALKIEPDIILCDILMDELDGYGVLFMLSKYSQTNAIPFIFITAKAQKQDLRKGMEMGADDYLIKPFDDVELLNAVETRLKKKKQQEEFYSKTINKIEQLVTSSNGLPELNKIIEERKLRTVRKKQVLYYQGDKATNIYLIHKGKIKTTKIADDGRELTTKIYNVDEFVGVHMIFLSENYIDNAIAIEDCILSIFSINEIEKLISQYPDVASKFIKILSNEIVEKEEQLLQMAYSSVRKRIAESLLNFQKQHCINGNNINLTRNELANLSGTAPETVSRTLTEFDNEGLIDKSRNEIILLNLQKLSSLRN